MWRSSVRGGHARGYLWLACLASKLSVRIRPQNTMVSLSNPLCFKSLTRAAAVDPHPCIGCGLALGELPCGPILGERVGRREHHAQRAGRQSNSCGQRCLFCGRPDHTYLAHDRALFKVHQLRYTGCMR